MFLQTVRFPLRVRAVVIYCQIVLQFFSLFVEPNDPSKLEYDTSTSVFRRLLNPCSKQSETFDWRDVCRLPVLCSNICSGDRRRLANTLDSLRKCDLGRHNTAWWYNIWVGSPRWSHVTLLLHKRVFKNSLRNIFNCMRGYYSRFHTGCLCQCPQRRIWQLQYTLQLHHTIQHSFYIPNTKFT
jgi:hypothetical protein